MDFYYMMRSPPCRVVLMTAKAAGIDLNLKEVDLMAKEHLKPEFLKINPQHSLPTLVDNGFALWESRAIIIYLAKKSTKKDSLYPDCTKKQALINQRLFFDTTMFTQAKDFYGPQIFAKAPANPKQFQKMEDCMSLFEKFLEGQQYAAGEDLTIADIALVVTVSMYELCKVDISKYPNVDKWYKLCKKVVPGIEINDKAIEDSRGFFKDI